VNALADQITGEAFRERLARLQVALSLLPDKPEETADSTLRALWHLANGNALSVEKAARERLPFLDDAGRARLDALIERRLSGVPLAHLTERQSFAGLEMLAGPDALVPRRETELLARTAIALVQDIAAAQGNVRAADACTGSGNVALAIAAHVPQARVSGADLSAEAVALAARNAEFLGLSARVDFAAGDLLDPFAVIAGSVDVLTCNPPYISSAKVPQMATEISAHEPSLAFDGGPLGVSILMRLLESAPRVLKPGGWLAFELGLGQGPGMVKRLNASANYSDVRAVEDEVGAIRVVLARTAADD
jgi:release factor glutamine methyltransferase